MEEGAPRDAFRGAPSPVRGAHIRPGRALTGRGGGEWVYFSTPIWYAHKKDCCRQVRRGDLMEELLE